MWKYLHWKPFLLTVIKAMLKVLRSLYYVTQNDLIVVTGRYK